MNISTIRRHKTEIIAIATKCNAENIRLFGSVARGEARVDSDVDFLVHMKHGSGFCIGGLKWRLEELLSCKVDIIPDTSIHPFLRDKILKEAVEL
jgi:predicted nucleotidyltransferase